jgi:hypothetical protein
VEVDCASITAANGVKPAELLDLDTEGFHVFIARPDQDGRVHLPEGVFGNRKNAEDVMILIKAKIVSSD